MMFLFFPKISFSVVKFMKTWMLKLKATSLFHRRCMVINLLSTSDYSQNAQAGFRRSLFNIV